MPGVLDRLTDNKAMEFVDRIESFYRNFPHLPTHITENLVKIAPWFALLMAILSLLAGPLLGLISILTIFFANPLDSVLILFAGAISIVNMILLFLSFGPLRRLELAGWMYLFWVSVLGVIEVIFQLLVGRGSVISILFALVVIYCLFEMKSFYSKEGSLLEEA
jgi:hypothetical protein